MSRKIFESMDEPSRKFYSRIINSVVLNMHAVQRGYFDAFLCETEDPTVSRRWEAALPDVIALIKEDNAKMLHRRRWNDSLE